MAKSDTFGYIPVSVSLKYSPLFPCVLKYLVFFFKKKCVKIASHKVIVLDFFQNSESIVELFYITASYK